MMHLEHRTLTRAATAKRGEVEVRAVAYGVVDDFGTLWSPGCLNEGFAERLPAFLWGHDHTDIVGRATSWRDTDRGPVVKGRVDMHADVPRGRQLVAQLESGTITDVSVGFQRVRGGTREPTAGELKVYPGVDEVVTKAKAIEISFVFMGAVPGADVLALRAAARNRPAERRLVEQLDRELDEAIARVAGRRLTVASTPTPRSVDRELDEQLASLAERGYVPEDRESDLERALRIARGR